MTPERWLEVRRVFDSAVELEGPERAEYLARIAAEQSSLVDDVAFLLSSHQAAGKFIEEPLARVVPRGEESGADEEDRYGLRSIGPWAVERVLGRGGMGTVYLAVRADDEYHQRVAIKVLRRELDSAEQVRRFRSERQILATLDHPSIARLLEGGTTEDGRPYLVMEYVEGEPLDRYCQTAGLPVERRLELFLKVCAAVQFAHQSLIVHRDLKPGNVLVTAEGGVKLLDFGIAKLLEPEGFPQTVVATEPGRAPMTLAYASPEQVLGEPITTASDVYSLGVVLYEVLTGLRPYRTDPRNRDELMRAICEEEPERPSTAVGRRAAPVGPGRPDSAREGQRLRRRLAGDLDNIVLKALEKTPGRRYATAEELARDIARFLTHRPIRARPERFAYRARKFLRRHRWGVAMFAGAFLSLAAFLIALLVQREEILNQRNRAEEVKGFLVDLFEVSDPDLEPGREVTAREIMDRGAATIPARLEEQPEVRAELLEILGQIYRKLGLYDRASELHERGLGTRREIHGDRHPDVASSLLLVGELLDVKGDYGAAEARYREALAILDAHHEGDDPAREKAFAGLARVLHRLGRFDEAERLYGEALDMARRLFGEGHARTAWTLTHLGHLARQRGRLEEAEGFYRAALEDYGRLYAGDHPDMAGLGNDLGLVLKSRGRFEEAERVLREALERQSRFFRPDHPNVAVIRFNMASLLYDRGRRAEAEELCRELIPVFRQAYGDEHPRVAKTVNLLGLIRLDLRDLDEAEKLIREALDSWTATLGGEHPEVAVGLANLARIEKERGNLDAAETLYREALSICREAFGDEHEKTAQILNNLGRVLRERGELTAAADLYRESLAIWRGLLGDDHPKVADGLHNLAAMMRLAGDLETAEAQEREALAIYEARLGKKHVNAGIALAGLASIALLGDRAEEADSLSRRALAIFEESLPEEHARILAARSVLGESLTRQRRYAEAETLLAETLSLLAGKGGGLGRVEAETRDRLIDLYEAWGRPEEARRYRDESGE